MWLSFGIRPAKNEHKRLLILKIQSPLVTAFGLSFFLSPKVGNSFQTAKHHSKNLHITSQKAFTTKLSSLSSMGGSPPFPRLRNSDTNTLLNPQQTKILPEKKLSLPYTKTTLAERYGRVAKKTPEWIDGYPTSPVVFFFLSPSRPPKGEHTKTNPAFTQWSVK